MQKNWYILYTKAKSEKKVSRLLTKKKIKNFCPLHCRQIKQFNRVKLVDQILFSCHVFVYMDESEIDLLKQLNHVVNFVYWNGKPAIIKNEEIQEIREFVMHHQNIRLERSRVNVNSPASVIGRPSYSVDGNVVMIKNKFIKVNLSSLGYTMVAAIDGEGVMGREIGARGKEIVFNSNFETAKH